MLLRKVEKFLRVHKMAATKFGRLAAGDPRFVLDLRLGRIPRERTEARTLRWMAEYEAALAHRERRPDTARAPFPHQFETKEYCHAA